MTVWVIGSSITIRYNAALSMRHVIFEVIKHLKYVAHYVYLRMLVLRSHLSFIIALTSLLLATLITGCSQPEQILKISGPTMGTEYHISWVAQNTQQSKQLVEKQEIQQLVDQTLLGINKSMSTYDPQSELSLLNKSDELGWQKISADLYRVLMMSMQLNRESEGAFDITVGPLVNLWGFGPTKSSGHVPEPAQIELALAKVGSEAIDLRQRDEAFELKLSSPRYMDLSAIAKGYGVDVLGRLLQQQGIHNYLVEVGGEIIAHGSKPENQSWHIAIEAPNDNGRSAQIIIPLSEMGVATSGDYRNFFEQDGQRFSHTIDGRTGYPVTHNLASVSVLHESVAMADAWATVLTVLGAEAGLKIAEEYSLAAYFIVRTDNGYEQHSSSHFEQLRLN
jgi:thiamine biosynthesis lipoprotein